MTEVSIDGICDTLKRCALISKSAEAIGLNIHCIRVRGTRIAGTHGEPNSLVPMIRVFNATARYVDRGGNKRSGTFEIYIEPWLADIFEFLDLKKNTSLADVWDEEFAALFTKYEEEDPFKSQIEARDPCIAISIPQVGTGTLYMLYKDY